MLLKNDEKADALALQHPLPDCPEPRAGIRAIGMRLASPALPASMTIPAMPLSRAGWLTCGPRSARILPAPPSIWKAPWKSLSYATPRLRNHLFLEAAVFQAWFRDNPSKALFWVYRIRNKKLTRLQKQRLDIALLWAEGRLFDAWEKLCTGISGAFARTAGVARPHSGGRERRGMEAPDGVAHADPRMAQHVLNLTPD